MFRLSLMTVRSLLIVIIIMRVRVMLRAKVMKSVSFKITLSRFRVVGLCWSPVGSQDQ